jgi:thioredoxin-related protein
MHGYFEPEPFIAMFEYVSESAYERLAFADYVKARNGSGTGKPKGL